MLLRLGGDGGEERPLPAGTKTPEPVDLSRQKRPPDQWQPDWIVKKYFDAAQ
jgi:hypothetical protein